MKCSTGSRMQRSCHLTTTVLSCTSRVVIRAQCGNWQQLLSYQMFSLQRNVGGAMLKVVFLPVLTSLPSVPEVRAELVICSCHNLKCNSSWYTCHKKMLNSSLACLCMIPVKQYMTVIKMTPTRISEIMP